MIQQHRSLATATCPYDANGNLLTLGRHKQDGSLLDEFTYSYTANTNKLASVTDASIETITYDEKIYSSGAIRHDGKVYRSITVKDNATAEAGQPAQLLQANESITLQPNFHAKAGSGFHAKWTTASNTGEEISNFNYTYDAIGNLITDAGEGTNITWTPYGKVRTVSKGDGTAISYQYDAAGNRISKRVTSNNQTKTTHYVRDASGNVLSIYQDEALQEQPIYGSSRLGMYRPKDSKADGSLSLGQRNYELSNHLGNVLSVITDEVKINTDGLHEAVILQQQDYFGFGLAMKERSWQSEDYKYRFGFNGQEKDGEIETSHFKFREYNSKIGRFWSQDPLFRSYPWNSTYAFAENDVIRAMDLEGLEKAIVIGGADLDGTGLSSTSLEIKNELQTYSDANSLGYKVEAFNTTVNGGTILKVYDYLKENYQEGEPLIVYGYSLGGHTANQVAKLAKKDGIKVNLFVSVDAALGLFSAPMEVSDNVDLNLNIYQTDRSILGSRGYPAKVMEGNKNTMTINYNYDYEKEEKGFSSHGAIDEETKNFVVDYMKEAMQSNRTSNEKSTE